MSSEIEKKITEKKIKEGASFEEILHTPNLIYEAPNSTVILK
jgi:hypothetical protein